MIHKKSTPKKRGQIVHVKTELKDSESEKVETVYSRSNLVSPSESVKSSANDGDQSYPQVYSPISSVSGVGVGVSGGMCDETNLEKLKLDSAESEHNDNSCGISGVTSDKSGMKTDVVASVESGMKTDVVESTKSGTKTDVVESTESGTKTDVVESTETGMKTDVVDNAERGMKTGTDLVASTKSGTKNPEVIGSDAESEKSVAKTPEVIGSDAESEKSVMKSDEQVHVSEPESEKSNMEHDVEMLEQNVVTSSSAKDDVVEMSQLNAPSPSSSVTLEYMKSYSTTPASNPATPTSNPATPTFRMEDVDFSAHSSLQEVRINPDGELVIKLADEAIDRAQKRQSIKKREKMRLPEFAKKARLEKVIDELS